MVPTVGRTRFLGLALRSVLAQDPGAAAMQIEVVDNGDDHDSVERLVRDTGGDRITIFRQPVRLGMAENWTSCVLRSRGELVYLLNDDDEVLPGFFDAYSEAAGRGIVMIAGQAVEIDEIGRWIGVSAALAERDGIVADGTVVLAMPNVLRTSAVVVPRATYEGVGGFLSSLNFAPDWEMWARAATFGPVAWVTPPRALYRLHAGTATTYQVRTGENVRDALRVVELAASRLEDPVLQEAVRRRNVHSLAQTALHQATAAARAGDQRGWLANGLLALRIRPSGRTFATLALALIRSLLAAGATERDPDPLSTVSGKGGGQFDRRK